MSHNNREMAKLPVVPHSCPVPNVFCWPQHNCRLLLMSYRYWLITGPLHHKAHTDNYKLVIIFSWSTEEISDSNETW